MLRVIMAVMLVGCLPQPQPSGPSGPSSAPIETSHRVGDAVVAQWHTNGVWYAAHVTEINSEGIVVRFDSDGIIQTSKPSEVRTHSEAKAIRAAESAPPPPGPPPPPPPPLEPVRSVRRGDVVMALWGKNFYTAYVRSVGKQGVRVRFRADCVEATLKLADLRKHQGAPGDDVCDQPQTGATAVIPDAQGNAIEYRVGTEVEAFNGDSWTLAVIKAFPPDAVTVLFYYNNSTVDVRRMHIRVPRR